MKGKHKIGAVSSAERGTNTTVVFSFSSAGRYVPQKFNFRRKRMADALKTGGPPGSHFECQEKGWMDSDLFVSWIQHFIRHVKLRETNPILLILDGHASHTSNLKAIEIAKAYNIVMLSLPPHYTHKLQPLDVGFFRALQTYYDQAIELRLYQQPGFGILPSDILSLDNSAFSKFASIETAVSAFRKCGIWPLDVNIFPDAEYAAIDIACRETESLSPIGINNTIPLSSEFSCASFVSTFSVAFEFTSKCVTSSSSVSTTVTASVPVSSTCINKTALMTATPQTGLVLNGTATSTTPEIAPVIPPRMGTATCESIHSVISISIYSSVSSTTSGSSTLSWLPPNQKSSRLKWMDAAFLGALPYHLQIN
ncbi:tigger transposable element-derived protein 1 [Plakobranchus ocellatus]|uniref:Tigger transposable element-derived protein 1 n=1 Tax=Plakobranchus ocellatus TaxID=259542 RepID=A0AAV4CNZ7_9GAST|nr:tigger transposable element-derived protein 1 [Plakobranchus ocellatus]